MENQPTFKTIDGKNYLCYRNERGEEVKVDTNSLNLDSEKKIINGPDSKGYIEYN